MEWTDETAAAAARQGDTLAFRTLVDRHSRALFRLAYRLSGNQQDAEDLVQETFLRAYKQLARFNGHCAFSTWLYRICTNCALDLLRARRLRKEVAPARPASTGWLESIASPRPGPDRLCASSQLSALLTPALDQLTDRERAAFILRHCQGCPIDEIARSLGIQPNAAKHTVFRAVQKLRRVLEPAWKSATP